LRTWCAQVLHVQVDDQSIVKYLQGTLGNIDLAMKVLSSYTSILGDS